MKNKIETYLGFCVKARKVVFGVDNVEKQKKGVVLLIADETLGQNSLKELLKAKEKFDCPLLVAEKDVLGEWLYRAGVKAVAITDKNLASAIMRELDGAPQLKLYSGGND